MYVLSYLAGVVRLISTLSRASPTHYVTHLQAYSRLKPAPVMCGWSRAKILSGHSPRLSLSIASLIQEWLPLD